MDESKLKEYLRRIITKELDEMSGTGALGVGAGEIQTPYWVHKGKGDNNATKEAERLGFKKVKTSMPSDSKVKDYKSLWGKKSKRKIYNESDYDKASPWGAKSPSDLPSPSDRKLTGDNYYKTNEMKNIKEEPIKKSRRFIPTEFEFPSFLLKPIKLSAALEPEVFFKIGTNNKGESILFISPLVKVALESIERGRTSFEKYKKESLLASYIREKVPQQVRVLIKKYSQGTKQSTNGFFPISLKIIKDNSNFYIKNPTISSIHNDVNTSLYETIEKLVKKELLNEVSYGQFKNEVKLRSKQEQLHKAMREVKRKLNEIERIVEYTGRMKQELSESEGGVGYWNRTAQTVSTIAEMVESLNTKIQNLK